MRISEAAAKFKIPRYYIDYWKKTGLLSSGSFGFEDLRKLKFLHECRQAGISLQKIRRTIEIQDFEGWQNLKIDQGVLVTTEGGFTFLPESGQGFFNFEPGSGHIIEMETSASSAQDSDEFELFEKALASGNLEEGKLYLNKILENMPDHVGALVELGNIAFEEGDLENSEEFYDMALNIDPTCVEAYYNNANIYFKQGKYAACIRLYIKCIDLDPDFPEPYYNLGIVYYSLKNFEKAENLFQVYIQMDPESSWSTEAAQFIEDIEQLKSMNQQDLFLYRTDEFF